MTPRSPASSSRHRAICCAGSRITASPTACHPALRPSGACSKPASPPPGTPAMRHPDYEREMAAIRNAARADLTDRLIILVFALVAVAAIIWPVAHLIGGMLAHMQA